jgi:16S rRNA (adenine1518-N6/adenine1519-N6)-dimethyltransferase
MKRIEIQNKLKELNADVNKRLGQNFLIDTKVINDMIEAAGLSKNDCVLEVGPGLGVLTEKLAEKAGKVVAIEKDKKFAEYLKKKFKSYNNVEIIHGDILKEEIKLKKYKIIANLPFYLTSRFMRQFLEMKNKPDLMVLLMQKEVAGRIASEPGKYSVLTVSSLLYGMPKVMRQISPKSFYPRPDVDCAVLKMDIYDEPKYKVDDVELFFKIVKSGFSARRKQIHNTLSAGLQIEGSVIKEILKEAGIDSKRRAQTLNMDEWVELYGGIVNS